MEDVAPYTNDKDDTPVTNGLNVAKHRLCATLSEYSYGIW